MFVGDFKANLIQSQPWDLQLDTEAERIERVKPRRPPQPQLTARSTAAIIVTNGSLWSPSPSPCNNQRTADAMPPGHGPGLR